jgi:hypothetical protein
MMTTESTEKRTWTEEIEVAANELVDQVKELVAEGNVRRLIIRDVDGKLLIEIPVTAGAVAGGALVLFAPLLAALGAMAALLARVTIEVVREE